MGNKKKPDYYYCYSNEKYIKNNDSPYDVIRYLINKIEDFLDEETEDGKTSLKTTHKEALIWLLNRFTSTEIAELAFLAPPANPIEVMLDGTSMSLEDVQSHLKHSGTYQLTYIANFPGFIMDALLDEAPLFENVDCWSLKELSITDTTENSPLESITPKNRSKKLKRAKGSRNFFSTKSSKSNGKN